MRARFAGWGPFWRALARFLFFVQALPDQDSRKLLPLPKRNVPFPFRV